MSAEAIARVFLMPWRKPNRSEVVVHDPHKVLDLARDPLESAGLSSDVVGMVASYLIDEEHEETLREKLIGTWEQADPDWDAYPDYWTFRFFDTGREAVRCVVSTRVLNIRNSTDKLTLEPCYDRHGFRGFAGSGHASWRRERVTNANYTFTVDPVSGLRGKVTWVIGGSWHSESLVGQPVAK